MESFNVVIATAGRPSLKKMVESILPQLTENDYITVIFDGCAPKEYLFASAKCNVVICHEPVALGYWGHEARNKYQGMLKGDWIMNADDDDVYTPDAMAKIRKSVKPGMLNVFNIMYNAGKIPHRPGNVEIGNIGTPCGVYPNLGSFPKWQHSHTGDGEFYMALSKIIDPVWHDEAIYVVRPKKNEEFDFAGPKFCESCNCAEFYKDKRMHSTVYKCRKCGWSTTVRR